MARYFFNLTNGSTIRDVDGEECADMEEAKRVAIQSAADIARNKHFPGTKGVYVCVTDEHGKEMFRTPLAL